MTGKSSSSEQRRFRADPLKLKRLRVTLNMTQQDFTQKSGLDRTTVAKILRGDEVFLKSLTQFAENLFDLESPMELLHPDELAEMGIQTEISSPDQILEWKIENHLSGWDKTSNGLQFQLVKLKHRYLPSREARGKCYELRHVSNSERERLEQYLLRHVEVCEQIGIHKNVAQNLTAAPVNGLWWVLDRWEPGETLASRLSGGALGDYGLRFIMTGIARGLEALHKSNVVRRELSPRSILLRSSDDSPVLTDMELAKLHEADATVSPTEWPDDPYRALEVGGDAPVDSRADLYSWGRIFIHAATGMIPEPGTEGTSALDVPDKVRDIVRQCLAPLRSQRPASIANVLRALRGWE